MLNNILLYQNAQLYLLYGPILSIQLTKEIVHNSATGFFTITSTGHIRSRLACDATSQFMGSARINNSFVECMCVMEHCGTYLEIDLLGR